MIGIEHFIRLARAGKNNPGASGGEKRASRLAECILENLPGLDDAALAGLQDFLVLAQTYPEQARKLILAPSPLGRRVPA